MSLAEQTKDQASSTPQTKPPVLVYLPGLAESLSNSSPRLAELMALKASAGRGSYVVEKIDGPNEWLTDGRRIVRVGDEPVLDIYTADYRQRLKISDVSGEGLGARLRDAALAVNYFVQTLALVVGARGRAKGPMAKAQLALGVAALVVLVLSMVLTMVAVVVSLGWQEPTISGTLLEAFALGATAFTTWVFFKLRPVIRETSTTLQQLLEYVRNERRAASVASVLDGALDTILDPDETRQIHILGYSMGSLVALDYLFPRKSLRMVPDGRQPAAVCSLITIGCPADFVRLYLPDYLAADRQARVPQLRWSNIFIAADVFGSNFLDGDDFAETGEAGEQPSGEVAGISPVSIRYTSERLSLSNIWDRRGFLSHAGYWDEPENANCLDLVTTALIPEAVSSAQT